MTNRTRPAYRRWPPGTLRAVGQLLCATTAVVVLRRFGQGDRCGGSEGGQCRPDITTQVALLVSSLPVATG